MNKDLMDLICEYTKTSHKALLADLQDKSKDSIIAILIDLLTMYYNDKNSSSLRQYVVAAEMGYTPSKEKIGYNGYKHSTVDVDKILHCEVKPKNINTNDVKHKKLDGRGNFTDYTQARLKKDKKANPMMLSAGFIDGKLIYIIAFPFNSKQFITELDRQLVKQYPNGDEKGKFLRSASFGLKDYSAVKGLSVKMYVTKEQLHEHKKNIAKPLFDFLSKHV